MSDQYLDDIVPGETLVINTRDFGFNPASYSNGDRVVVISTKPRPDYRGWYVTVRRQIDLGDTPQLIGYEWLDRPDAPTTPQEDTMTHRPLVVGDRVVVTDARTAIGGCPLGSGLSGLVGKTGTVSVVITDDDYRVDFDDVPDYYGTWSLAALDLLDDNTPARPLIDFSGSSRATARAYAADLISRVLKPESQTRLRNVADGEKVDALDLNEAVLDAMRSCATRDSASSARRDHATQAAYLGHIVQAVIEAHADSLPTYEDAGVRSRKIEDLNHEVSDLKLSVDRHKESRQIQWQRAEDLAGERTTLTQAASDERRRLVAEIDDLKKRVESAEGSDAEAWSEVTRLTKVVDYAHSLLGDDASSRLLGYSDGTQA